MAEEQRVIHTIPPVFDENSKILILGSFPSVKSRESNFFYGHPQNRFWRVLAQIFNENAPETVDGKKEFLLRNRIALWDVVHSCTVTGSSDSSIKDIVPNDISEILKNSGVKRIFANGATAHKLYNTYLLGKTDIEAVRLPSTSPANAAYSLDKLVENWKIIRKD